ncbi:MAG TPA: Rrf2 family transcriptional regulator [Kiritimatiellia bacterium]|nr:Rrf2 family transcriptional regulator [Kiritimatiellia bacterium]
MLTSKTKYALQALQALASRKTTEPVLIAQLAEAEAIPRKYLERILLELKARGILRSQKGKGGGYALAKDANEIPLADIVRWMDGPLAPVSCVSQTAYAPCRECKDEACCGIRLVMKEVRDSIAKILGATTLADMLRRSQDAKSASANILTYEI